MRLRQLKCGVATSLGEKRGKVRQHIDRRDFLKRSVFTAASLSGFHGRLERTSAPKRVIVAGAGLSGLCAAYELTQAGHDVTILEARSYSGGRVHTVREPFAEGLHAEAGAARIPISHEWTIRYTRLFNLTLIPFYPKDDRFLHYRGGKRREVRWKEFSNFAARYVGMQLGPQDGWFEIKGGNDSLPNAFAARLADRILFDAPVTKIEHDARGVRVYFSRRGVPESLAADRMVCTIPFSVLKGIEVAPQFSAPKSKILKELAYDSVSRIFLQCRARFWEGPKTNGFAITDQPAEIWPSTFNQPGTRGIMQCYLRHDPSRQLREIPESRRIRAVVDTLERVFPGTSENFETGVEVHWADDKWVRGGWAHPTDDQLKYIKPPEGRVHFAGEHTSSWSSWMQGALESGNRAAREINEAV